MMHQDIAPAPGYPEPYGLLVSMLQDTTSEWRGELPDEISAEAMMWQPFPGGHSMGAVFLHIIDVEISWLEGFVLGQKMDPEEEALYMTNDIDVDAVKWPTPPSQPLSWYVAEHNKIRTRILESIKRFRPADEPKAGKTRTITPRWVLNHVIQHEAYHGGQIVLLYEMWLRSPKTGE